MADVQFGALEVDVGDAVERDKVHVRVRDLEADDGHAHALAGDCPLELEGDIAGKQVDVAQQVVGQVKEAIDLQFGDDQRVALGEGLDLSLIHI